MQIINDNFQNYKKYGIPKAQLVIADIPYNLGVNAYASSPLWYNATGTIKKAKAKRLKRRFLTRILISTFTNISIFAIS